MTHSVSVYQRHTPQHDTHLYSALCMMCIMQGSLLHLVGSDGVSKMTAFLYVTPCSLVEQQQRFRKIFRFHGGRRSGHQAPLLTFLNLRSLRSPKTLCRANDCILILHCLAAFCHCHLLSTHYYNPPTWVNSLCCKQHNTETLHVRHIYPYAYTSTRR